MRKFIPHQTIICDDKDPLWIRGYRKNNNIQISEKLMLLQKKLHLTMEKSKDIYYSDFSTKLVKQKSNPKTYWSLLKRFLSYKKHHVSHHYFMKTNSWLILEKRLKFLIFFFRNNVH